MRTVVRLREGRWWGVWDWGNRVLARFGWGSEEMRRTYQERETVIQRLWIDVRAEGRKRGTSVIPSFVTPSRALCITLTDIVEKGPDFKTWWAFGPAVETSIDELVLNVVTSSDVSKEEDHAGANEGDCSRAVASDLVNMWNQLWTASPGTQLWQVLLERVKRVRVCIDGETWKVREIRLELERGQAERRRIAARSGYYRL